MSGRALQIVGETGHLDQDPPDEVYDVERASIQTDGIEAWTAEDRARGVRVREPSRGRREPRIPLLSVAEIMAPLPPIPYLVEAFDICPGAPTLAAGLGFSAKTLLTHAAALAVATGAPAWGKYAVRQGGVILLDYEQGEHLTRRRIQRMARGMALVPEGNSLRLASMPRMYLDSEGDEKNPSAEDELTALCKGVALLIVDSLSAACPTLEENSASARKTLDMLGRVSEATGCVAIVIHHARKPSQNDVGGARNAIRGSGAIFDACGSVLVFERRADATIQITHEKARTSGKPHAPITLAIVDTPDGGLAIEDVTASAPSDRGQPLDHTRRAILAYLTEHGAAPTKGALVERLRLRRNSVFAALAELEGEGAVEVCPARRGHPGSIRLTTEEQTSERAPVLPDSDSEVGE